MKNLIVAILACLLGLPGILWAGQMALLTGDMSSLTARRAVNELDLPKGIRVETFSDEELRGEAGSGPQEFLQKSQVIIVDVMNRELATYLLEHVPLAGKKVYAVRGTRHEQELEQKGFIFDPEIKAYYDYLTVRNLKNLLARVAQREFDPRIPYEPPEKLPPYGIYHPAASVVFEDFPAYAAWYKNRPGFQPDAPWLGVLIFSSYFSDGQKEATDRIIRRLEEDGWNVLTGFGKDQEVVQQLMMDGDGRARVDLVLAFSLKFSSALNEQLFAALRRLNRPILNAISLYSLTVDQWRRDPVGIPPLDLAWLVMNPEVSGLIEPSPLSGKERQEIKGKTVFVTQAIPEALERELSRLKGWLRLKRKSNADKRVAILFYNHSQGKQNIGASYLNVFASLENILQRLSREGYRVEGARDLSPSLIQELILKTGYNVGSWAPGELEKLLRQKQLVRVSVATYKQWFAQLPQDFQERVLKEWGPVEKSNLMIKDGQIIIPAVVLGNFVLLPEPARGWGDDPRKLYHSTTLYPHHQYVAAYLWLRHGFQADAMIHLGTHATYEWLPGKQAGLSPACPSEIMVSDIPNLYPYIVDDVGEGMQAKRRGRAVIIDHLTPALKEAGLYQEYEKLHEWVEKHEQAREVGSATAPVYLQQIEELVRRLGIDKELGLAQMDKDALEKLHQYLHDLESRDIPYGLHTFGRTPPAEALAATVKAILKVNQSLGQEKVARNLADSGPLEMERLIRGLNGEYLPPGEGNDPVRNPEAIPTGKNFYGFDPHKIPTPAAYSLGQKAARDIIEKSLQEKGRVPAKVAQVLWAVETLRNEGINESTIMALLGIKPRWDQTGRLTGLEVIPGRVLGRPRIDVLITPSGLYRDLFPQLILLLDQAVQKAAVQTDIENLLAKNTKEIAAQLQREGLSAEQAEKQASFRIFTETPGSYGTGVAEVVSNSGTWKSSEVVAEVYQNRMGHTFGQGEWGLPARKLLRQHLRKVEVALHSRATNIYGLMDNDDMFQYLGGLALAVQKERGQAPDAFISVQNVPNQVKLEGLARYLGAELRSRYLNPTWIAGMKKEEYAGAREMSKFVEYFWGWQVTTPHAVDKTQWEQTYEVYVEDKYGLDLRDFFNRTNPYAFQSITSRMLEAIHKGYWQADDAVQKRLAKEYALNVIQKGVACCEHTCNNPLLHQMVVNLISLPGVMAPELVEKFQLALEQAGKQKLTTQVSTRVTLQQELLKGFEKTSPAAARPEAPSLPPAEESGAAREKVEGFKMEEVPKPGETTKLAASGVQWFALLFIFLLMALGIYGMKRHK